MGKFDSGIKGFVTGVTTIYVKFPVNWKDEADISCKQCPLFFQNARCCGITKKICAYPEKYVGADCPLEEFVVDIDEELEGIECEKNDTPSDAESAAM